MTLQQKDELAAAFWDRVSLRCYDIELSFRRAQSKMQELTGARYSISEAKCRNTMPDMFTVIALSKILDVSCDWLLGVSETVSYKSKSEKDLIDIYRSSTKIQKFFDDAVDILGNK